MTTTIISRSRRGSSPTVSSEPSAARLPMEPGKVVWQIDETRGRWRDFPKDLNALVEQSHADGRDGVQYVWPPIGGKVQTTYTINFHTMLQTNESSGFQRRVRRLIETAVGDKPTNQMEE